MFFKKKNKKLNGHVTRGDRRTIIGDMVVINGGGCDLRLSRHLA